MNKQLNNYTIKFEEILEKIKTSPAYEEFLKNDSNSDTKIKTQIELETDSKFQKKQQVQDFKIKNCFFYFN